jgi:hypothetical protein
MADNSLTIRFCFVQRRFSPAEGAPIKLAANHETPNLAEFFQQ